MDRLRYPLPPNPSLNIHLFCLSYPDVINRSSVLRRIRRSNPPQRRRLRLPKQNLLPPKRLPIPLDPRRGRQTLWRSDHLACLLAIPQSSAFRAPETRGDDPGVGKQTRCHSMYLDGHFVAGLEFQGGGGDY